MPKKMLLDPTKDNCLAVKDHTDKSYCTAS